MPDHAPSPCPSIGLTILHRDTDCIVVLKPSGLHSVPGLGDAKQDSVLTRLQALDPAIFAAHRLDRDTSGVMVFGCHAEALSALGRQFQARSVDKRYVARVAGQPSDEAGEIHAAMRYDPETKPRQVIDAVSGKPAHTRWRVLSRDGDTALLALEPVTGRTHQLRLHLQFLGHPILGDALYAPPSWQQAAPRLCLHAELLAFDHPRDGRRLQFHVPETFDLSPPGTP